MIWGGRGGRSGLFLFLGLLLGVTSAHQCIHDTLDVDLKVDKQATVDKSTLPEPIRIGVEYVDSDPPCTSEGEVIDWINGCGGGAAVTHICTAEEVLTTTKRDLQMDVIADAVTFFGDVMSVMRPSSLSISSGLCCALELPSKTYDEADFVLYVTFHPNAGDSTLAWATTCRVDGTGRPIAGMANFAPEMMDHVSGNPLERSKAFHTAVHEITHALGFSATNFGTHSPFRQPDGQPYAAVTTESYVGGEKVDNIVTPTVLSVVRRHFGCETIVGAELENQGSSGSKGSHWESRLFNNEFMTASGGTSSFISPLTLAFFQDTGWYTVDVSATHDDVSNLKFGKDMGCDFTTEKCNSWENAMTGANYFCGPDDCPKSCSYDRRALGYCNLYEYPTDLPTSFQYFDDPKLGASGQYADWCPRVVAYSNGFCSDTFDGLPSNPNRGQIVGSTASRTSLCFESTAKVAGTNTFLDGCTGDEDPVRCHQYECIDGNIRVYFTAEDDSNFVQCPTDGGNIALNGLSTTTYVGILRCPPSTELCGDGQSGGYDQPCASGSVLANGKTIEYSALDDGAWVEANCTNSNNTVTGAVNITCVGGTVAVTTEGVCSAVLEEIVVPSPSPTPSGTVVDYFTEDVYDYENTSLTDWLNELPHRNFKFETVPAIFRPENRDYQEALAVMTLPAVVCAILTLGLIFCHGCYKCCRVVCNICVKSEFATSFREKAKKSPRCYIGTFLISALIVVGGNMYGYLANEQVADGVSDVQTAVKRMDELKSASLDAFDDVATELDVVVATGNEMDYDLQQIDSSIPATPFTENIKVILSDAMVELASVENEVNSASRTIVSETDNIRSQSDLTFVTDSIKEYEGYRWRAQLAVLAVLSMPFIMTLTGFMCKFKSCLHPVTGIGYFTAFIGWLICAAEIFAIVGVGDFCSDPNRYLSEQVGGADSSSGKYLEYYTVCTDIPNPSQDILDEALAAIAQGVEHIHNLDIELQALKEYIPTYIHATDFHDIQIDLWTLGNQTEDVGVSVATLVDTVLRCNAAHNTYTDALRGLCHDALEGFFALVVIQAAMATLTYIAILCARALKAYWKDEHEVKAMNSSFNRRMSFMFDEDPAPSNAGKRGGGKPGGGKPGGGKRGGGGGGRQARRAAGGKKHGETPM